ncbi:MAG: plastocyanin/azurin family copper-binding protein [Candidatus Dadabacteria bacterium]|nr:plastocyanin/azurin family copper-binding protein [Candidatus Dadabacteria bacterium]
MLTRRNFMKAGGVALASLAIPSIVGFGAPYTARVAQIVEIFMKSDPQGSEVWFDPIGVYIEPGQTVRWIVMDNVHTTTAYHPKNDMHSLRIPEGATPWDSGFLVNKGDHFDLTLTVEGVYDYFCMPHEQAGMVGRIVVGKPAGPGALSFDYFKGKPGTSNWKPVPISAQKAFPSVEVVLKQKIVRRG